ncbi:MAG: T9SS type A sorting domain-containing protein [Ignavibacteriae bacterium]|nr:T9SS type A sorting domain-containing protein [Ignavibacteriota bacterium]
MCHLCIIVVLTLMSVAANFGQTAGWTAKTFDAGKLQDVSFVDSLYGWVVGTGGKIMNTINGGRTWSTQSVPTGQNLNGVDFFDRSIGFVVGDSGIFLRTTDGGIHWNVVFQPDQKTWWKVHFATPQMGWKISANSGGVWYTSDSGTNWTLVGAESAPGLSNMWFTTGTHGWVVQGSELWHTIDGVNWASMNDGSLTSLIGVSFPTDSIGYLAKAYSNGTTDISIIYRTTNAGSQWTQAAIFTETTFQDIYFLNTTEGWTCGYTVTPSPQYLDSGCVYRSSDFGDTWNRESFPDMNNYLAVFERVQFVDRAHGWAVGASYAQSNTPQRLIARYQGTVTAVYEDQAVRPLAFSLDQNYPNPFNPETKIHFTLAKESFVNLKIFDLFGREVVTLMNDRQLVGEHFVEWNAANFASGVYYYTLHAGDFFRARTMLLLK